MGETYYERLGVSSDASIDEIETAYRERLKETHPDVSDESDAQRRTQQLIEAKEVLTDEKERSRYDRLGHQKYVSLERQESDTGGTGDSSGETGSATGTARGPGPNASGAGTTAGGAGGSTATGGGVGGTADASAEATSSTFGGGEAGSAEWYDGTDDPGAESFSDQSWKSNEEDTWRAWNTEGSYSVNAGDDPFRRGRIFSSDRAFVMLAVTFLVYPILLFGSLYPGFPLIFRFLIAICTVLIIAILQSTPEVGIAVFGTWSILMPVMLFSAGIDLLTIESLLALTAVMFPLGLSLLTRLAIRPASV